MPIPNKLSYYSIIFAIVILVFEGFSFVFFSYKKERFSFADLSEYTLSNAEIEMVAKFFDYSLGWKTKFDTIHGERPAPKNYDRDLMATFGDSFTFCEEVREGETWQAYLSSLTGKNVFNFGNGAYGIDQALLRFKQDYPKVNTKLVSLGLISENICRVVNVYRKFYMPSTGVPATKPRFILRNGQLFLINNPIESVDDLSMLQNENFIRELGQYDYWYKGSNRPRFAFPFSSILFNGNIWRELRKGKLGDQLGENQTGSEENIWQDEEAKKIFFSIIDSFAESAKVNGAMPVILIFPKESEINLMFQSRKIPPAITEIFNFCRDRQYFAFCPINELVNEVASTRNTELFEKGGHYSPKANQIIAKSLYEYLRPLSQ